MLAWCKFQVFGREIQESEIAELHIFHIHTDLTLVSKTGVAYHHVSGDPGAGRDEVGTSWAA
jgi:hypothetical protein